MRAGEGGHKTNGWPRSAAQQISSLHSFWLAAMRAPDVWIFQDEDYRGLSSLTSCPTHQPTWGTCSSFVNFDFMKFFSGTVFKIANNPPATIAIRWAQKCKKRQNFHTSSFGAIENIKSAINPPYSSCISKNVCDGRISANFVWNDLQTQNLVSALLKLQTGFIIWCKRCLTTLLIGNVYPWHC